MRLQKFSGRLKKPRLYMRLVVGDSMMPTLSNGQLVLFVPKRRLQAGSIVMVRHGGKEKIKRLARIEDDRVYLLGDNAIASTDSRKFGWLDVAAVQGELIWPRRASTQPEELLSTMSKL